MKRIRPSICLTGIVTIAAAACTLAPPAEDGTSEQAATQGETHPYQDHLVCERAPGSTLVGVMYDISSGTRVKVTEFSSYGNVGACELAIRASRNRHVCVPGSAGFTVRDLTTNTTQGSYSTLTACTTASRGAPVLRTEPGYVDFLSPAELAPFRAALPNVTDPAVDAALKSPRTIWYDESSLTFVYQDSFGDPRGLRANRVGYDVGSNASEPDIHALVEYFEPQKFKFPFSLAAGATFQENLYVLYFWQPPVDANGAAKPVRIWKNNSHWQWVFPVGTILGEAMFIQAPDDKHWFSFELRSRTRRIDGWTTNILRPYLNAADLSQVVKAKRPAWSTTPDVRALVDHLDSPASLTPHTLTAPSYAAIFPPMQGAMDYLPETTDVGLVKELLTGRTFDSAMGSSWKAAGTLTSYAASTHARFHIVPAEYPGGMLATSEAGCRSCHEQTSRPLNNLDPRVVLYGEVWGEDEVFTWHPFAIDTDTFSVADGNRNVNARLVTSGLVQMATPASDPLTYRALPKPYVTQYE